MSYSLEDHNQVQGLIGANIISNEIKAFFQLCGHQSKCNICKKFGHHSKNCPLKDLKCDKCKRRGHVESECNFANMARFRNDDDMDDYLNEENINENDKSTHNLELNNSASENNALNVTIASIVNQINSSNAPHLEAPQTVFKSSTILPPLPAFNPNQPPAEKKKSF